ncbi:TraB/GumN family protein [Pyxidicoccus xibeiensis]|uniref:hypothetical protein n=1 Tax=Pyxidicoccus xibeiensis TaxID=2906759 RepID=UPI0020A709B0|nr:hypothetical protein [Pyxidicoccus xibeiensis]MCP3136775.1 hypothetical protein [Pyxidicoccus xibeiensis]
MLFSLRLLVGLCGVMALTGCASAPRTGEGPALPRRFAQALQVPVEETLAAARQLLVEGGYTFEGAQDPGQLLTDWRAPKGQAGATRSRYLVTGISVGPLRSVVRAFRMTEGSGGAISRERDFALEEKLGLRLVSGASSGVARGRAPALPPATAVREEHFYLTRWQEEPRCPRKVRGLKELLKPGLMMLIGEQLGSREAPQVVGDLVCQAAEAGQSVALGLSIPRDEQARIDRYLASAGTPTDQDALLEGPFWRRPYQDGRSSRAVFDLIDRVRAMRELGLHVSLVAYDTDEVHGSERDAALADVWLKRHAARPEEVLVVLAGNTHVRTVTGTPWDKDFTPMAHHLQKALPELRALELGYAQGKRWGCDLDVWSRLDCRIVTAAPEPRVTDTPGLSPYVRLYPSPTEEGYQGLLFVGELSPSRPAIEVPPKQEQPARELKPSTPPPRPPNY